jgi:hypothetical protein
MIYVKHLVLDILKPHQPNVLEFSSKLAETGQNYHVVLSVLEVDKHTETIQVAISAEHIDFDAIQQAISSMGGSLHSIDQVEVSSNANSANIET